MLGLRSLVALAANDDVSDSGLVEHGVLGMDRDAQVQGVTRAAPAELVGEIMAMMSNFHPSGFRAMA